MDNPFLATHALRFSRASHVCLCPRAGPSRKAAFLGVPLETLLEQQAPAVWLVEAPDGVAYYTKPELDALRVDGARAEHGSFLVQVETTEAVTGGLRVRVG